MREISKITGFELPSVKLHIKGLEELGIIDKGEDVHYPKYYATRNNRKSEDY